MQSNGRSRALKLVPVFPNPAVRTMFAKRKVPAVDDIENTALEPSAAETATEPRFFRLATVFCLIPAWSRPPASPYRLSAKKTARGRRPTGLNINPGPAPPKTLRRFLACLSRRSWRCPRIFPRLKRLLPAPKRLM